MRIIIIGAGPSGLAALQALLSTPEVHQGIWNPTVFEAASDIGGVWHPSDSSPVYEGLTTNLPHPIMAFPSFPFPPSTPLFPSADTVQRYLQSYADHFHLREHITLNARVEHVVWDHLAREWHVTVHHSSGIEETHSCSLLLVCNGHHNVPRIPPLPGLSDLLVSGRASHSQTYRSAASFFHALRSIPTRSSRPDTVLVVGSGPSGQDISAALAAYSKYILLSTSKPLRSPPHPNVSLKPRTTNFLQRRAFFEDGSSRAIDYVILATGYTLSFPFFPTSASSNSFTLSTTTPIPISLPPHPHPIHTPLTLTPRSSTLFPLARHLFGLPSSGFSPSPVPSDSVFAGTNTDSTTLPPPTSIAFLGLLVRVAPLPIAEAQARAIIALFRASSKSNSNTNVNPTANANDTETHIESTINWTHEHDLIRARHASLSSSFLSSYSSSSSPPPSTSPSPSTHLPSSGPSTLSVSTTTPSPSSESPDRLGDQDPDPDPQHQLQNQLQNHLSSTWDILTDPTAQFTYRDSLDDLCFSLSSPSLPFPSPTSPFPPPTFSRTRVQPWEPHFYSHKDSLRQSWRLLEERGLAKAWVAGVGTGHTADSEWVALMHRVLMYWEDECRSGDADANKLGDGDAVTTRTRSKDNDSVDDKDKDK